MPTHIANIHLFQELKLLASRCSSLLTALGLLSSFPNNWHGNESSISVSLYLICTTLNSWACETCAVSLKDALRHWSAEPHQCKGQALTCNLVSQPLRLNDCYFLCHPLVCVEVQGESLVVLLNDLAWCPLHCLGPHTTLQPQTIDWTRYAAWNMGSNPNCGAWYKEDKPCKSISRTISNMQIGSQDWDPKQD